MATWLDVSREPVHVLTFPAAYDLVDVEEQFGSLAEYYRRLAADRPTARIAIVVDLSAVNMPSEPARRALIARAVRSALSALEQVLCAQAYVISSPDVRGAVADILRSVPPPWPVGVFAEHGDAERWVAQHVPRDKSSSRPPRD
jgi:hypothetical protein